MKNEKYDVYYLGKRLKHIRIKLGHDYIAILCEYFEVSADYFYFGISKPFVVSERQEVEMILLLLDGKSEQR